MIEVIIGLLTISLIAAFLAFLIEIADIYIADYGEQHILINGQKDLLVTGGRPLLQTLSENDVFLPSACGGKGTCGYCKVRVTEGGGPVLPTETPYLDEEELKNSVRISCQLKVKEAIKIEIPEELFQIKEYRVTIDSIERLTPDIKTIHLNIPESDEGISFKAGQYIQLLIPPFELTDGPEFRAYSIASPPYDDHGIDLVITKVEEGTVSTYVHDYLQVGQELSIRGPFGEFYLRDSERDLLLIGTGSGIAPIRSILYQLQSEKAFRKITLYFGDRRPFDLLYEDEIHAFEKSIATFTYIPTLSRTIDEDNWTGEKGRVTDLIEKYIPNQAKLDVYICGAPAMVNSCCDLLEKKGINLDHIWFDKFE